MRPASIFVPKFGLIFLAMVTRLEVYFDVVTVGRRRTVLSILGLPLDGLLVPAFGG